MTIFLSNELTDLFTNAYFESKDALHFINVIKSKYVIKYRW